MSSLVEKMLFSFETMKVYLYAKLEHIIGDQLAQIGYELNGPQIYILIYLFRSKKRYKWSKQQVLQVVSHIEHACNQSLKIRYHVLQDSEKKLFPKYYFLYFKNKFLKTGMPIFSILSKLNLDLVPQLKGIYIAVKGKRGLRKSKKNYELGTVSKHSYKKQLLLDYHGAVESSKGTTGIYVKLAYHNDRGDKLMRRTYKI